ncbi:MAG TPA: OsmC family protein [Acidobacteriaceae bacterium]|jgi:putative redox protein
MDKQQVLRPKQDVLDNVRIDGGETMVAIEVEYQGELHCHAVHGPSQSILNTDAPKDNQGRGESFAPTDLVAAALGSCILTTMGILARSLGIDMSGAKASVEKEMTSAPPRMIRRLSVVLSMPQGIPLDGRQKLERAAHTCAVHKSLHPDIEIPITFNWQ